METLLELPWWLFIPLLTALIMFWVSLWLSVVCIVCTVIVNTTTDFAGGMWVLACIAVTALFLFGCGVESEFAVASNAKYQIHGVVIYADTEAYPSRYAMQEATDIYIKEVAERFGYSEVALVKIFKGVGSIAFHDHEIVGKGSISRGLYVIKSSDILLDYAPPCIRQSLYWHELNHHFLRELYHDVDAPHGEETWWRDLLIDVKRAWFNSPVRETCR